MPTHIGKYEVVELIGNGGFADVYLARNPQLEEKVAIKVPRAEELSKKETEAFLKEAKTAAELRHPNIVAIRDADLDADGRPYVVMDWLEGGTLDDVRQSKVLSIDEIVNIMRQIAAAAAHAHRNEFVHRDLKPSNILFDKYGRPQIADFGLAIHERDLEERRGEFAGTRRFMSPEQVLRDTNAIDSRCDVWALGVILYLLLTAEYPFDGTHSQVEDAILGESPKPPKQINSKISEELQGICLACLTRDLGKRLPSADALVERLEAFTRRQDASRSRRKFLVSTGVMLAVGATGTYGGYWLYDQSRELRAEEVYRRYNAEWDYNEKGHITFKVIEKPNEPALLFLTLGEVQPPLRDFDVEITLGELNRELGIAIVLGYRNNTFHQLMLLNTDGNIKVERKAGEFTDPVHGYYKLRAGGDPHVVGPVEGVFHRKEKVTVQVRDRKITGVLYGDVRCEGVEDAFALPKALDSQGYVGRIGIMTTQGAGTIEKFEIKPIGKD